MPLGLIRVTARVRVRVRVRVRGQMRGKERESERERELWGRQKFDTASRIHATRSD
jgi:hypothetical protein